MNPVSFPQQNMVLADTQPQYTPLSAHFDRGSGAVIGCFQPTEEERQAIAAGGPVWLWQYTFGRAYAPVCLSTDNPWGETQPEEQKDGR